MVIHLEQLCLGIHAISHELFRIILVIFQSSACQITRLVLLLPLLEAVEVR